MTPSDSTATPSSRHRPRGVALALAMGLWCLAGGPVSAQSHIELPEIGDSAGTVISQEQERKIGEQFMRQVRRYAPLISDPELNEYIQGLGESITEHVDYHGDFTFFLLDLDEINAFAVPGGFIGFHSGLILNSHDENEVASVMAHEIVHVTQRHSIRGFEAQKNMTIPGIVGMLGAIMLAAVNPEAGQAAIAGVQALQAQNQLNFTRSNEQEADRIGIQLLAEAGYEPDAMARFFERLKLANRYNDPKYIPEYLRTHPVTNNRIAEAKDRAARLPSNVRESSLAYHHAWAKLKARSFDQPLAAVDYFETVIENETYRHPDAARYGYAISLARAGRFDRAEALVADLIERFPEQIYYRLAAADIARDEGDFASARRHYEDAMLIDDSHRGAVYGLADLLTKTGEAKLAREVLRDFSFRRDPDLDYYRLLAYAEGESGDVVAARVTISEYYFRAGELRLAREQLRIAQRQTGVESYQRLRIEARLAEIDKALAELEERS
mgnify:CR=1 FL=1